MAKGWTPAARVSAWVLGVAIALLLLLAVFPWGLFAGPAAGLLSTALGRRVTISSMHRRDLISLTPHLELRGVAIAQPGWAGTGDTARIDVLRLRLPVIPLLVGRARPSDIVADGVALHLVRSADGRENWSGEKKGNGSESAVLEGLTIRNARVRLDDAGRHAALTGTLAADEAQGFHLQASGTLLGRPLSLVAAGAAIRPGGGAYPLHVRIHSPLAALDAQLRMDRPLDTRHFDARVTASAEDLDYLDDIVQAGLFRTQDVRLTANVRHDHDRWRFKRLNATVGRSTLVADLAVTKADGRTHLSGRVDASALDFDDFASDADLAKGAAKRRAIGPRVVPDTRIALDKIATLDGTLAVHAARLLSSERSPFRSLSANLTLDHSLLSVDRLRVGLPQGRATGSATIDGRGKATRLKIDLTVADASIETAVPGQRVVAGPMRARIRLNGTGDTVRRALATSVGRIGMAVVQGSIRKDYATFLSGDVIKGIGAAIDGGSSPRVSLACLVADITAKDGRLTPERLILSTERARGDGTGVIVLGPETVNLRLVGRATHPGILVSTAPVLIGGTLSTPRLDIKPPRAQSAQKSGAMSRIGFFLKGLKTRAEAPPAPPVNCASEAIAALR